MHFPCGQGRVMSPRRTSNLPGGGHQIAVRCWPIEEAVTRSHRSEDDRTRPSEMAASGMSGSRTRLGVLVPRNVDPGGFAEWAEREGLDIVQLASICIRAIHAPRSPSFGSRSCADISYSVAYICDSVSAYSVVLIAKMLSYVDWLSIGRLEVGIGLGGEVPQDLQGAPVSVAGRGRYVDAALPVVRNSCQDRK